MNLLFRCSRVDNGGLDLKSVTRESTWQTWNSQTIKNSHAEMLLMTTAARDQDSSLFGKCWVNLLIPEKQVVIVRRGGRVVDAFMALSRHSAACLGWPVSQTEKFVHSKVSPPPTTQQLWRSVHDVKEIYIVPTKAVSPLRSHMLRKNDPSAALGCYMRVTGKPVPLVDYLWSVGFARVPEAALKKLREEVQAPELDMPEAFVRAEDGIAACPLVHLRPKMTEADFQEAVLRRIHIEEVDVSKADPDMTSDIMDDVLLMSDKKLATEQKQNDSEASARRAKLQVSMQRVVESLGPRLKKAVKRKACAVTSAIALREKKHGVRWWCELTGTADDICMLKPEEATCFPDNRNCRFLLHHHGLPGSRLSVSWTKRGMIAAMQACLRIMWGWEKQLYNRDCPLSGELLGEATT